MITAVIVGLEDGWQYVVPGYVIAFGLIGIYSVWVVRRGRKLAAELPDQERRFLD